MRAPSTTRRRRLRSLGRLATGALIAGVLLGLVPLVLVVPNAMRDDAPLPAGVDPSIREAIESVSFVCGPHTRITEFVIDGEHVRYRCTWSILGWPVAAAGAICDESSGWEVGGFREMVATDVPCE